MKIDKDWAKNNIYYADIDHTLCQNTCSNYKKTNVNTEKQGWLKRRRENGSTKY